MGTTQDDDGEGSVRMKIMELPEAKIISNIHYNNGFILTMMLFVLYLEALVLFSKFINLLKA